MENIGIFCERDEGRTKNGQNLSIERQNIATLATPVTQHTVYRDLNGVSNSEAKNGEGLAAPLDTPQPTMQESHVYKVSNEYGASGEAGAAKNLPLTKQYERWFTVCEDVSDADIPPEFL